MKRSLLLPLMVAVAALVAYSGTLLYDFVWDDTLLIQQSHRLHQWSSLRAALTSHLFAETQERSQYYRPLITLSFFLDLKIWGLRPMGFHLTNVLAHMAAALALFGLTRRLTANDVTAFAAAALFAVHPVHSESVAFISGRTDVLAALFFLLTVRTYMGWRDSGRSGLLAVSLGAYLLAMASKEVAVTLPAILAAYDWSHRGDLRTPAAAARALARYLPYGGVVALYAWARVAALGQVVDSSAPPWGDLITRALTSLKIVGWYAWMAVVPYPSSTYYVIFPDAPPPGLWWWFAAGFLAVALVLTVVATRRSPPFAFGALWFWITMIPFTAFNILPLNAAIMAERFLYLPSAGVCLILGIGFSRLVGPITLTRSSRVSPAPALGFALLLIVYSLLGLWRNEDWKDDYRLYLRMVETSPDALLPRVNLAFTQIPRGEVAAAHVHLKRAMEIAPKNGRALAGLGVTETILGERDKGLELALKGYAYAPRDLTVLAGLGTVYLHRDEPGRALPIFEESLRINPNQVPALLNLTLALSKLGRHAEAESALGRVSRLSRLMAPGHPLVDRVTAEVYGARDPERAAAAWERYVARLRAEPEPTLSQQTDLTYAETRLARLRDGSQ